MKKIAMLVAALFVFAGCQSMDQDQINALATAGGAAIMMGYNSQGTNMLSPEQKKIAVQVVKVMSQIGDSVTPETIGNLPALVNSELEKQIKDPAQLAMAKNFATVFLGFAAPYMKNQTAQNSIMTFVSFCKGLSSVELK